METFTSGQQRNQKAIALELESEEAIFKELIKRGHQGLTAENMVYKVGLHKKKLSRMEQRRTSADPKMMDSDEMKGEIAEIQ